MRRGARLCAAGLLAVTLAVGGAASAIVTPAYAVEGEDAATESEAVVAAIGDSTYTTLQDAVDNCESGKTIELQEDVSLTQSIQIKAGATVTINGNGHTIALSDTDWAGTTYVVFNNTKDAGETEGLKSNTTLSISNTKFKGHTADKSDHVVVTAGNASGVIVTMSGCTFTNLYDAVYCNYVTATTNKINTVSITGSTFENVAHAYGVDNGSTPGALTGGHQFELNGNTNQPDPETFAVAEVNGVGYKDLQTAVDAAKPGDTVELAAGTIDLNGYTGKRVNVHKPLTIVGSDEGTTIKGALWVTGYDAGGAESTVTLRNIDFVYIEGCSNQGVCANDPDVSRLNVENCSFTNYVFAIGNGGTRNFTLAATDVALHNVWCGVGFQKFADDVENTLESFDVVDGSTVVYEVQGFGSTEGKTSHNGYYISYNDYVADTDNANNNGMGGDDAPVVRPDADTGSVPNYVEQNGYEVTLNGFPYESLEDAVANANADDTIALQKDVELTKRLAITKGVTLDLNKHTISAAENFTKDTSSNTNNQLVSIDGATGVIVKNGTIEAGPNNYHVLNVWNSSDVTLDGLTLDHSQAYGGAPLIVGASDVTLAGDTTFIVGNESWYAGNVDSRDVNGTKTAGSIATEANTTLTFKGVGPMLANGICIEDTAKVGSKVAFGENTTIVPPAGVDGFKPVYMHENNSTSIDDAVDNPENAGIGMVDGVAHVHQGVHHEAVAPTCTEDGTVEYWKCAECGKLFSDEAMTKEIAEDDIALPAKGHDATNAIHHAYKAPTATEPGNIEYWECPTCHALFYDAALKNEITAADAVVIAPSEEPVELYTVTFKFGTGEDDLVIQVPEGQVVYAPKDPTYDGFTFLAWYTDEGLTEKYDFSKPVTGDLTLYAGWAKNGVDGAATTPEAQKADANKSGLAKTSDPTTFLPAVVAAAAGVTTVAGAAALRRRQR